MAAWLPGCLLQTENNTLPSLRVHVSCFRPPACLPACPLACPSLLYLLLAGLSSDVGTPICYQVLKAAEEGEGDMEVLDAQFDMAKMLAKIGEKVRRNEMT